MSGHEDKAGDLAGETWKTVASSVRPQVRQRSGWHAIVPWGQQKLESLHKADREALEYSLKELAIVGSTFEKAQEEERKKLEEIRKIAEAKAKQAEREAVAQRELVECPVPDCGYTCRDNAKLKHHFERFHAAAEVENQAKRELLECPVPDCGYGCRDDATLKRHFEKFHVAVDHARHVGQESIFLVLKGEAFKKVAESARGDRKPISGWHTDVPWGKGKLDSLQKAGCETSKYRLKELTAGSTFEKAQEVAEEKTKQVEIEAQVKRSLSEGNFASLDDSRWLMSSLPVPTQHPNIDLDIEALLQLEEMQAEFGLFSYYNHHGSKIIVHAEDERAQENAARIEKQVRDLVKRCSKNPDIVDVIISPRSFNMKLCGRIGAAIHVKDHQQAIGMYLSIRGHVYWTSVAHNFIAFTSGDSVTEQVEKNGRLHTGPPNCYIDGLNTPGNIGDKSLAETPTPYACCMIMPHGVSGQRLMHTVDFMIGQLPLMACHLQEGGSPPRASGMQDVRDPCLDCGDIFCTQPDHRQGVIPYSIREVFCLTRENDGCRAVYKFPQDMKPSRDNPIEVHCYSAEKGIMRGRICSDQVRTHISHLSYVALNAILVEPVGNENPDMGDCGTVWVLKDTSKALAMTIAMGDPHPDTLEPGSRTVWVAELLVPCLDALCKMHGNRFPNIDELNPIFW